MELFENYRDGAGDAYDEMFDGDELRGPYRALAAVVQGGQRARGAGARGGADHVVPRAGRHLRHRRRGAGVPARHHAAGDRAGRLVGDRPGRPAAGQGPRDVPRRRLRHGPGLRRRGGAARGRHHLLALPPGRGRGQGAQRRPHPRGRHRPDPRRRRQLPGAGGQRPGAVRGVLRDDQPAGDLGGAVRGVHRAPDPAGRLLPAAAAQRAAGQRPGRRRRPDGRGAHAGRVQRRLLRARAARPDDGHRAGRGPRPGLPARPGDDADHAGPRAGARDLPPRRRRVPRPGALPLRLDARLPRA